MARRRRFPNYSKPQQPGATPGQIVSPHGAQAPVISVMAYGPNDVKAIDGCGPDRIAQLRQSHPVVWVDVTGLADPKLIGDIGATFGLHPLALEDVANTHQRPKVEAYDNNIFIVARMLEPAGPTNTEQVSMFLGEGFLVTFQERTGDCFHPVRDRLRKGSGMIGKRGADYLCYALIDAIVDFYFPALERAGDTLEMLEDQVVADPSRQHVRELHEIKRELLMLRRAIWPHREMINTLIRDQTPMIEDATRIYLRDCYDHTIQLMDIVETYREIASGLVDVYMSSVSVKLNEVMKVLTVIATIFIPLSFIASLYGMNFDTSSPWNMPELHWRYGYPMVLLLMFVCVAGLFWYFWRKGWIRGGD